MEREKGKLGGKRGPNKTKATLFPSGDFIALGSKSSRNDGNDLPSKSVSVSKPTSSSAERKREGTSSSSASTPAIPTKKIKLSSPLARSSSGASSSSVTPTTASAPLVKKEFVCTSDWDALAIEVEASDLLPKILDAEEAKDEDRQEALLCGAVKALKTLRVGARHDPALYLTLMFLAKKRKALFISDTIIQAFCSLLKREVSVGFKGKSSTSMVSILASNVLLAAFHEVINWPEEFVKMYVEDSLGERVWVDSDECKGFVDNILTAFGTVLPPKSMMAPELNFKPDVCPSPPAIANLVDDDETSSSSGNLECKEYLQNISIIPRYKSSRESVEQYILDTIREQLARRQPMEVSRNMLRLLISTCGLSEVRNLVAQKLEMWLQNPKLTRPAQDLLSAICLNCSQHTQQDVEVISQLIRVRMKTKPIISHFLQCMKELLKQHPDNLTTVLKHAIYNELSNARNPNNMQLLGVIFQHAPEKAAKGLAGVFFELLSNRDDYLRALRALLREIVRTVRHDLHYTAFCLGLLLDRRDNTFKEFDLALKERILLSVIDLIVLTIFLAISPTVREAASSYNRTEKKDLSVLRNYQHQVTVIQRDTVWWLHTVVPKIFKPGRNEFIHCLHKVLFMEQVEHYYNKDNWPPDGDRHFVLKLASEVPLLDDTLMRILIMGFSREHTINAPDALELADQLVKRAASIYSEDFPVLKIEKQQIFEAVFNLCAYHHPENITLPSGYKPPNLAIADLYWKSWVMLLIIVAHNPSSYGLEAWEQYPTLRYFMEMCITNHFSYPPPTVASGEKADEIRAHEIQISQLEKQAILEFESHLAAASTKVTITEGNSLLLSKLITMDPLVIARKPSGPILEQVKTLNQTLKLGHLLCRSRRPDFLLDIIQRQGTSQSMPWLAELVESSEGSFSMLPVQCLCEFLLNETAAQGDSDDDVKTPDKTKAKKRLKQKQLLQHLQLLLHSPEAMALSVDGLEESQATREVLDYFLRRLASQQTSARALAMKGLNLLLMPGNKSPMSEDEDLLEEGSGKDFSWLLKAIPSLPHFPAVLGVASSALRQACQVENDPSAICAYVKFLSAHAVSGNLEAISDLALDMAQLIVERPTIVNCIVPPPPDPASSRSTFLVAVANIFVRYLRSARIPCRDYPWSRAQDHILVQWATGESATMHILVVHAMVMLLTYGPPSGDQSVFTELLETWFPSNYDPPQAFLVDTSEEALLLPDWLKLRMIRSSLDTLVNAALKELEPSQLVLFVQSFGIPVPNMSKLLMCLDLAVEVDSCSVEQSIVDKSYMAQLVEVQHQRGAQGGHRFARLLADARDTTPLSSTTEISPIPAPVIQRAPPRAAHPLSPSAVYATLIQMFDVQMPGFQKSNLTDVETFQSLHKAISLEILKRSNQPFIEAFIGSCEQILKSTEGPEFIEAFYNKPVFASALFRLIISATERTRDHKHPMFLKLQSICYTVCLALESRPGKKSPLGPLLKLFLSKYEVSRQYLNQDPKWKKMLLDVKAGKIQFNSNTIMEVIRLVETEDPGRLEEATQQLVAHSIQCSQVKQLVQELTTLVASVVLAPLSPSPTCTAKYRLFVDWIAKLEPEVMGLVPEIQQRLLFSRSQSLVKDTQNGGSKSLDCPVPFRPYFLALLTHQAGWETLRKCIRLALDHKVTNEYDPSSVLDFLWACIHIPKIWQGKDKHIPKHYLEEDVLSLTEAQVISVTDFVIHESVQAQSDKTVQDVNPVIASRLPLLIRCCGRRRNVMTAVADYLLNASCDRTRSVGVGSKYPEVSQQLLLQLYLQVPSIMLEDVITLTEKHIPLLEQAKTAKQSYSQLDTLSHTLLISLSTTDSSKQCTERMSDLNLACRKLASAHPLLLLRQLPMIAALLRGRVNLEFAVFRSRNHLTFFSHILGLLELLAPHILLPEFGQDLVKTLNCYLEFFQANGSQNPELSPLLNRFLGFVQSCLAVNPNHIRPCLQQHINTLHDLSQSYPDLAVLKSLLAGSSWLHHPAPSGSAAEVAPPGAGEAVKEDVPSATLELWSSLQKPSGWSQSQLTPMAVRLHQDGNTEDVVSVLQDLENISNRKPNILDYFVDEIKSLIHSHNRGCRQGAFNLMIKHMKNKPGSAREFVTAFLQCLEHEDQDIVLSALQRLPEIVILAQEYGALLLQKAFAVGISTNINSAPQICETMNLLNVQSGS